MSLYSKTNQWITILQITADITNIIINCLPSLWSDLTPVGHSPSKSSSATPPDSTHPSPLKLRSSRSFSTHCLQVFFPLPFSSFFLSHHQVLTSLQSVFIYNFHRLSFAAIYHYSLSTCFKYLPFNFRETPREVRNDESSLKLLQAQLVLTTDACSYPAPAVNMSPRYPNLFTRFNSSFFQHKVPSPTSILPGTNFPRQASHWKLSFVKCLPFIFYLAACFMHPFITFCA